MQAAWLQRVGDMVDVVQRIPGLRCDFTGPHLLGVLQMRRGASDGLNDGLGCCIIHDAFFAACEVRIENAD